MAKEIFFIADAHLNGSPPAQARQKRLFAFLDHIKGRAEALYILGDLFDFWFEYGTVIFKRYQRLLFKLQELSQEGVRIIFFGGNHDFWLDSFLRDFLGAEVYQAPLTTQIEGLKIYISHGEELGLSDWGYLLLRSLTRNRFLIFLFKLVHPDLAQFLADKLSRLSRRLATAEKQRAIDMALEKAALKMLKEEYNAVILAHTHRPKIRKPKGFKGTKVYINVGDWQKNFTYGRFKKGKFTLKAWGRRPKGRGKS